MSNTAKLASMLDIIALEIAMADSHKILQVKESEACLDLA